MQLGSACDKKRDNIHHGKIGERCEENASAMLLRNGTIDGTCEGQIRSGCSEKKRREDKGDKCTYLRPMLCFINQQYSSPSTIFRANCPDSTPVSHHVIPHLHYQRHRLHCFVGSAGHTSSWPPCSVEHPQGSPRGRGEEALPQPHHWRRSLSAASKFPNWKSRVGG